MGFSSMLRNSVARDDAFFRRRPKLGQKALGHRLALLERCEPARIAGLEKELGMPIVVRRAQPAVHGRSASKGSWSACDAPI